MQLFPYLESLPAEIAAVSWLAILATWFGTGLVEPFQGFLAALTILPFLWISTSRGQGKLALAAFLPVAVLAVAAGGYWFALTGVVDDGRIVIDEVAGMFVAAIGGWKSRPWTLATAPLYAVLDRLKPWPLSQVELFRKTDIGVLLDDCAVGMVAAIAVIAVRWMIRRAKTER
ncbi:phosphatidylglycerophosphatase A [Aurantimonas sp. DM33-3]|uniref:phosphatidylglycerophosphatase A family protein n=1 Tax=Aurantimonas sp. DM33-3 TaxID=2766955 RepID=UPI001651CDAA|nr:phosphatidylglycerophosphatase A [Aurantimonas sp. DM33-3]MBC6718280.1 phosphatidylglycerophosphatase A [Aurantimonas sp. DM33-3]